MNPKHLFFFVGRPSSGKETQSTRLAQMLGYQVFMTGARFREMIKSGSHLGNRVKADYEKGLLMPAWVADYLFEEFLLNLAPEDGAVFEGAGRDVDQAKTIQKVSEWLGRKYTVLNLKVSDDTVVQRALLRGRADGLDKDESVIRTRLAEYDRLTDPAIQEFERQGVLIDIDGEKTPEEVHAQVMSAVSKIS